MATFPPLRNDLLLRAARGEPTERTPVWIMRQAGRYLPEFQHVRKQHDFFTVCRTPELAAEVTIQPVRRFSELDAAIIFSDILVVPQALGMVVEMVESKGPVIKDKLETPDDIDRLLKPNIDVGRELRYVFDAITLTRKQLDGQCPLIGFAGAPWTLMVYMVEGEGTKTFSRCKKWLYGHRNASHRLLSLLSNVIVEFLVGQAVAGAQALQLFDTYAGELAEEAFHEFGWPYLRQIGLAVKQQLRERRLENIPLIVFPKGAHHALRQMTADGVFDVIGLDWTIDPGRARRRVAKATGSRVTLQGNLDPAVLYADAPVIEREVRRMLEGFGTQSLIANLGHGLHPTHEPDKVAAFISAVHRISEELIPSNKEKQSVAK